MYDPSKCLALYGWVCQTSHDYLIGPYFTVGAVTQDHVHRILLICCHIKWLIRGMFFCLQFPNTQFPDT